MPSHYRPAPQSPRPYPHGREAQRDEPSVCHASGQLSAAIPLAALHSTPADRKRGARPHHDDLRVVTRRALVLVHADADTVVAQRVTHVIKRRKRLRLSLSQAAYSYILQTGSVSARGSIPSRADIIQANAKYAAPTITTSTPASTRVVV